MKKFSLSLLLQERGLKSNGGKRNITTAKVAPLAGAWIEIFTFSGNSLYG